MNYKYRTFRIKNPVAGTKKAIHRRPNPEDRIQEPVDRIVTSWSLLFVHDPKGTTFQLESLGLKGVTPQVSH